MRTRTIWFACALLVLSGGFVVLSLTQGQEPSATPSDPIVPSRGNERAEPIPAGRDLSKLPPLQQQMYLSVQRGGNWLRLANRADGRFTHGWLPDLRIQLEGDHYLRQAGATFALARAARFLGDDRATAIARQAVLTLLLDTAVDAEDPQLRHTTLPPLLVNRLAAVGLLVLAINELPSPGQDLLEQSEQLCAYIRKQQAADGSLNYADTATKTDIDPEGINSYPGAALYGLMRSQRHKPAEWKTEVVRKARPYYQARWQAHKNLTFVSWQTAAYAEAFFLTKEKPFAGVVLEMTDWLCELQYEQLDPRHPLWTGGFMEWVDGKPQATSPQISSAAYAEGLAEAFRVARLARDEPREQRYRLALERCLQFLNTLQYTDANTQHFAEWYRPVMLGAFHRSHQDGTLRIDYTQHAVCALVQYLSYVGE